MLRAIFIAAGAAIIASFSWVFYIFGAFLIYTAWKLIQEARTDEEEEEYEENKLLKAVEKRFGVADRYHGTKLWIEENGKRVMTPMLVVMLAIGTTDVLFALDSIPAIFGLTQDPYIVFTANAFALMGLRQLYFLIGGLLKKLVHLSLRPVDHPRLHRRQAGAARPARVRRPRPGDLHPGLARRHLLRPGRHHDHQPDRASKKQAAAEAAQEESEGAPKDSIERLTASDVGQPDRERCAANCRAPLPMLRRMCTPVRGGGRGGRCPHAGPVPSATITA